MTELVFLSDLHLGAARKDGTFFDGAFGRFIEHLGTSRRPDRLVLLGDFLDLLETTQSGSVRPTRPDTSAAAAIAKIDQLAREHAEVFEALRRLLQRGVGVEMVVGNHDLELAQPKVQEHLRSLLTGEAPETRNRVGFTPWFLYIPGLVYAAHGHQLHDINAGDEPLGPVEGSPQQSPLAAYLPPRNAPLARTASSAVALAARGALAASPGRGRRRRRYLAHAVEPGAAALGVPAEVAAALYDIEFASLRATTRRMALTVWRTRRGAASGAPHGYLHEGARRIHGVLALAGLDVPFYVFGHSHVATDVPLLDPHGARYLNDGTWSPFRRGASAHPLLTFARVRSGPAGPEGSVLVWDDEERAEAPWTPLD